MPFSDDLKAYRAKAGLTQAELAEKAGITRQTVINWEKGVTEPDVHEVKTLSKILGFNPDNVEMKIKNPESIYRDLVEANTDYRLVPKTILDEEYRILLKSEIDRMDRMVMRALDAKDDLIKEKDETIKELKEKLKSANLHSAVPVK